MISIKKDSTRIYFATDIHGSEKCWKKLVNAGAFYDVKSIILGGDIIGKGTQIILEEKPGTWITDFLGEEVRAESTEALKALENRIRNAGFYPYVVKPEEFQHYSTSPEYRDEIFVKIVSKTTQDWVELAEEKLKGTGRRLIVKAGNDDPFFIDEIFKQSKVITFAEQQIIMLDDIHEMLSEGYSNPTPWHTHRELDEDSLFKVLDEQAKELKDPHNAVFSIHVPPYDSTLDSAPKLHDDLRPMDGGQTLIPVGSTAVRNIIETYQPILGLHGHIHESRGSIKIGRTLCINPGSTYGEGVLCGALITLDKKGVRAYQPVQG